MSVLVERSVSSPHVKAIIGYWNDLRGGRTAPQASEINPLDIPGSALPYIILSDLVSGEPFRIRYRLVGTHVTNIVGGDFTGRCLDQLDLPSEINELIVGDYAHVVKTCQPVSGTYPWPSVDNSPPVLVQYAFLPLLTDDRVTRFLCAEHIFDEELGGYLQDEDLFKTRWREKA